jgi:hypothetical protein
VIAARIAMRDHMSALSPAVTRSHLAVDNSLAARALQSHRSPRQENDDDEV